MKFPFTFNTALIFRLTFPGLVLATALFPAVDTFFVWIGLDIAPTTAIPVEAVFWGWLVVLADLPIYMLVEGRRFWPPPLRRAMKASETRRLARLNDLADNSNDERKQRESEVELLNFPIDPDTDEPSVRYPTRLGNLLTAYETYPDSKYGLDGVFYWYRLWLILDKDLRGEIDNSQAVADSGVYMCFTLWLSVVPLLIYAAADRFRLIYFFSAPRWQASLVIAAICAIAGYTTYRFAVSAHQQYGEMFKAMFDQYQGKLDFVDGVVEHAISVGADPDTIWQGRREKYRVA